MFLEEQRKKGLCLSLVTVAVTHPHSAGEIVPSGSGSSCCSLGPAAGFSSVLSDHPDKAEPSKTVDISQALIFFLVFSAFTDIFAVFSYNNISGPENPNKITSVQFLWTWSRSIRSSVLVPADFRGSACSLCCR